MFTTLQLLYFFFSWNVPVFSILRGQVSQAPHHSEQKCQIHLKRQGMLDQVKTGDAIRCSFLKSLSCKTPLEQSVHGVLIPKRVKAMSPYTSVHVRTQVLCLSSFCIVLPPGYLWKTRESRGRPRSGVLNAYSVGKHSVVTWFNRRGTLKRLGREKDLAILIGEIVVPQRPLNEGIAAQLMHSSCTARAQLVHSSRDMSMRWKQWNEWKNAIISYMFKTDRNQWPNNTYGTSL